MGKRSINNLFPLVSGLLKHPHGDDNDDVDVGGNNRDQIFNAIPCNATENIYPSHSTVV